MPDEHIDPSGNTEAFQAFVRRTGMVEEETKGGRSTVAITAGVVVAVIVVVAVVWFLVAR